MCVLQAFLGEDEPSLIAKTFYTEKIVWQSSGVEGCSWSGVWWLQANLASTDYLNIVRAMSETNLDCWAFWDK